MKTKLKKIAVALSAVLALSAVSIPAHAEFSEFTLPEKMMMLGAAGIAVGAAVPGVIVGGFGACAKWHCFSGFGSDAFEPVEWGSLSSQQQNAMIGLMEFYTRNDCLPTGARSMYWTRLGDHEYAASLKLGRAKISRNNKDAEQFASLPYNSPVAGAQVKIEPDDEHGFGVHAEMRAVRSADAHVGMSCIKDVQSGTLNLKAAFGSTEAWVMKNGNIRVRKYDETANKKSYSQTQDLTWDRLDAIVKSLADQDKAKNF